MAYFTSLQSASHFPLNRGSTPEKMEPGIWRLGSGKMSFYSVLAHFGFILRSLGDFAGANYVWDGMRPK